MKVGDLVRITEKCLKQWPEGTPGTGRITEMNGNGVKVHLGDHFSTWVAEASLEATFEPQAMRDNQDKPELNYLLTFGRALLAVAQVSQYGASKYERGNYLKGAPLSQHVDCLLRHLLAWYEGEDIDPESGQSHLGHMAWNALRLCQEAATRPELDDRISYKKRL